MTHSDFELCCEWIEEQRSNQDNFSSSRDEFDQLQQTRLNNTFTDLCANTTYEECADHHHDIQPEILYVQIGLLCIGAVLNLLEIFILKCRNRKLKPSEYLLVSLAMADALFCVNTLTILIMLVVVQKHDIFVSVWLEFALGQLNLFSVYASIFHVLLISIERLVVVLFSFRYKVILTRKNMLICLTCTWILTALAGGALTVYQAHVINFDEKETEDRLFGLIIFCCGFLLCFIYIVLSLKILKSARFLKKIRELQRVCRVNIAPKKIEKAAFIFAFLVSVGFVLFTFPIATILVFPHLVKGDIFDILICVLICNSIFNPTVYFWKGHFLKKRKKTTRLANALVRQPMGMLHTLELSPNHRKSSLWVIHAYVPGRFRIFSNRWDGDTGPVNVSASTDI